ncbi:WYL domain-containing protein [Halorussus lipolyticus]|uniref:WYL domain-containing protein n=1 Tax=Halorussus lipolyticus TaxID=3034024 RepID=UPI003B2113DB
MTQPLDEIDSLILEAMDRRKTLELEYNGEDERRYHEREFEPWCYGVHVSTGHRVLRTYQVAGHSESGMPDELPFWRLARLDRMRNVSISENDIRDSSPPHYNPEDKHMRNIFDALPE